ncbi:SRPBCC family protein, partial [Propylenella binzhouense]
APAPAPQAAAGGGRALTGKGSFEVAAPPSAIWRALLDPETLRKVVPGAHTVNVVGENHYQAEVSLGVGPIKGRFVADVRLSDLETERFARLAGGMTGPLGGSEGTGDVTITPTDAGCRLDYVYSVVVSGKVASVGGRMMERAAEIIIGQFFERLAATVGAPAVGGTASARAGGLAGALAFLRSLLGRGQ